MPCGLVVERCFMRENRMTQGLVRVRRRQQGFSDGWTVGHGKGKIGKGMKIYHRWTAGEEGLIRKWYNPRHWWGMKELAVELGVTRASLECHVRVMKKCGKL